jgi:hypothetical protein
MKREVTTTMKRGEVEAPSRGRRTPRGCSPSYIKGGVLLLLAPIDPIPFLILLLHQYGECLVKLCQNSLPPTLVEVEEEFRQIPTSDAPLERGNEGRHRAVRVTKYGSDARCGSWLRDLEIDA